MGGALHNTGLKEPQKKAKLLGKEATEDRKRQFEPT
jgi:hypothetical protein